MSLFSRSSQRSNASTGGELAHHSTATKVLHAALLTCILWQLVFVQLAERPRVDRPGNVFFTIHEWVGLVTFGLVVIFWLWSLVRHAETPVSVMFPWLSARRLAALGADLRAQWAELRRLRLPGAGDETPLASAVHGLGLLTVLAMGATGAWLFTMTIPGGLVLKVHRAISNLLWAFVIGHASLAVLHQWAGHRVLRRMFGSAQ
jgi:cytochrome b561